MIALNYTVMLNGYSPWLNIRRENYFIVTSVVLTSVMPAFNKKKLKKNKIYTVFMLFVHCKFEGWMWNYCIIKAYLKTLILGGINHD